jgi:hypothetical protein
MDRKRNTILFLLVATFGFALTSSAAPDGVFSVTPVTDARISPTEARVWSVTPGGPGWLVLPPLAVEFPGGDDAAVFASPSPGEEWQAVQMVGGRGSLPFPVPTVAALWNVRLKTSGGGPFLPRIVPLQALALAPEGPVQAESPSVVTVTNWGGASWIQVRATDAVGSFVALETLGGADAGPDGDGWHDLGFLTQSGQASLRVTLAPDLSFPVLVEARTESGEAGVAVLAPENLLAGADDMIHYYGMAKPNWDCETAVTNGTYLWIVGIEDGTTYTVTDLDTSSILATGTVNRGGKASLVSPSPTFVDNHRFRLATSRPVQAFMGFDCSETLPGSMFFLADDGRSMYGSAFTVPVGGIDGRTRTIVFASGAGSAEIRAMDGTLVDSHAFTAAGYWDATSSLTANTIYAVTSSGTTLAVQQSSQNAATEVPPTTMVVGGGTCAPSSLGNKFYVHVQDWNGEDPALVAIGYSDVDWRYRLLPSGGWNNSTVRTNNTRRRTVAEGFYEVEVVTAGGTMGLLAGSYEGGTDIWDLGDDSVYYRGTGSNVRGHALSCGGSIFVAHDGTVLDETGATTTPALPATFDAGDVITLNGNTSTNTPFRIYSQDESHPVVVEVFGGNCSTRLNDWSKVMLPAALARPVITYPDASGYLNDLTPTVTGTAVAGATVTLRVYDHNDSDSLVFTGTATVASDGSWSIEVTDPLTENHLYYFEAIQGLDGACPVDPLPPPGSSGSEGEIDTTPPAAPVIAGPADGSTTGDNTPAVTGTAEANSTVTVCVGAECHTTLADASGDWSLDWPTALPDGPTTVSATATDAAGNTSPAASNDFTVDTAAPAAPVITGPADGSTTGDNTPAVTGTAEANSTVTVCLGAECHTTFADASGDWSLDWPTALPDGPTTVSATATDAAGNTSPAASNDFTVDTAAPAAPAVVSITADTGTSASDGITSDPTLVFHGTAEAGSTVHVFLDGVEIGTAAADGSGDWSFDYTGTTLADGPYAVTSTAVDGAGNTSPASAPFAVIVDTAAPAAPTVTPLTTNDTTPAMAGTLGEALAAGDVFTVVVNGVTYTAGDGNLVVAGTSWTLTVPAGNELPEGTYPVTATVTDAAGNSASDATTNELVIDTTPPSVSVTTPAEGSTTGDSTPTISGTTDAAEGSTVTVTIGAESHTTLVQAGGSWSLEWPTALPDGPATVSASVQDPAGNVGSDSNDFTVLATPPSIPPIVTSPLYAGASVTVNGSSAEAPGSVVTVYVGGLSAGTALIQADGSWSLAGIALADGQAVNATVLASGKLVSGLSNTVVVASDSGDLTPVPTLDYPVASGATSVTGTSTPNAVVDVYADGYYLGTVAADGSGIWSLGGLSPLPDGTLLSATATLAPGGTSSWSNTVVVGTAIHLLRSDDLTSLTQPIAPLFERRYPAFSSMAAMGPNHQANWGEGADPTLPGTSDDDKAYVRNLASGSAEPDAAVLADNGRPLVFYELVDNGQKTLFLTKSGGNIVFTYTP